MEIVVSLGEKIYNKINRTYEVKRWNEEVNEIRKAFLLEYKQVPPTITLKKLEGANEFIYGFELKEWAKMSHVVDTYTYEMETREDMFERLLFYLNRFIRKWYMSCPDITIERRLNNIPTMIEIGSEIEKIVDSEEFFFKINSIKSRLNLTDIPHEFWESDYVGAEEVVIYIHGKDYFLRGGRGKRKEKFQQEKIANSLEAILVENLSILKGTPQLPSF